MTSNNETVSRQMPWAGNIAKTMTSNGKQFTVTREMLTTVAGISARYSKCSFVLFCYITNHLMTGPLGNSNICFPRISMFPSTSSRLTLRFSGNKIHCSPRDQSLSVYCCMWSGNARLTWCQNCCTESFVPWETVNFVSLDFVSGNTEILGKQNSLFSSGAVILSVYNTMLYIYGKRMREFLGPRLL